MRYCLAWSEGSVMTALLAANLTSAQGRHSPVKGGQGELGGLEGASSPSRAALRQQAQPGGSAWHL